MLARKVVDRPDGAFLVLSYNLLCHSAKHLGHFGLTKKSFPWEQRWTRFEQEFALYDADVVCLQEVNKAMYVQLLRFFGARGFEGLHIVKHLPEHGEAARWMEETLGQAIFVRHCRFEIEASSTVLLRDLVSHQEEQAADTNTLLPVIRERAEGVLSVAIREVGSGKRLVVACAHPTWFYSPPAWATKTLQIDLALRAVAAFAHGRGLPAAAVVICGDWNSCPGNGGYELVTIGYLGREHHEHPAANGWALPELRSALGALTSAYAAAGDEPAFTTKTPTFKGALDHIFIGSALEVSAVLPIPSDEALDPCPNDVWPSDHLAIGAFLRLL